MKDAIIAIITVVESDSSEASDTGRTGGIFSKSPSRAYNEGWERVFGGKGEESKPADKKNVN